MWSHYAKDHTGVVLEFRVLPDQDNPLCAAGPVQYLTAPPSFFTEKEWLDDIVGLHSLNSTALYYKYAHAKSDIWSYEREWRVWDLTPKMEEKLHTEYDLRHGEIGAIYLGCRISPTDRAAIESLRSASYANAALFETYKAQDQFKLSFRKIS